MKFFGSRSDCYQKICSAYGDYLRINGKLLEASLMYEKAGDFQQAIASARNSLAWRKCLSLSKKKGCSEEEIFDFGSKLVIGLQENSRYDDAVQLLKMCRPTDFPAIVNAALKGKLYKEALFQAALSDASVVGKWKS
jgi:elongator complex protein 1